MKERIEENTGILDLAIGTSFHKSYNNGRTFGRTSESSIVERLAQQEKHRKTRKTMKMALSQGTICLESRKDRFMRSFELVEIRGVEPLTFSMPLANRERIK